MATLQMNNSTNFIIFVCLMHKLVSNFVCLFSIQVSITNLEIRKWNQKKFSDQIFFRLYSVEEDWITIIKWFINYCYKILKIPFQVLPKMYEIQRDKERMQAKYYLKTVI